MGAVLVTRPSPPPQIWRLGVGFAKKHQLWKKKARRVFSRAFRHAELNDERKNIFQELLRAAQIN